MSLTSTPSIESASQERLLQRTNDDAAVSLMHMGTSSPAGPVVPESNADVMPAYEASKKRDYAVMAEQEFWSTRSSRSGTGMGGGRWGDGSLIEKRRASSADCALLQQRADDNAAFTLMFMDHL